MKKYSKLTALLLVVVFTLTQFMISAAAALPENPTVFIDNQAVTLKNQPVLKDGVAMIPLLETFSLLGTELQFDEKTAVYTGESHNGPITITADNDIVIVKEVKLQKPEKVQYIDSVLMAPYVIVEDTLKTTASYDINTGRIDITKPEPYIPEEKFDLGVFADSLRGGITVVEDDIIFSAKKDNLVDYLDLREVEVEDMPFKRALEMETLPLPDGGQPDNTYSIQGLLPTVSDFMVDEVGIISFYWRAINTTDESGYARFGIAHEQSSTPFTKAGDTSFELAPEDGWRKEYVYAHTLENDLPAGQSRIQLRVGYKAQVIQLAQLEYYNYKNDIALSDVDPGTAVASYEGMEDDALWRKEALKRIEKHRKNDVLVTVRDEKGNPLQDAQVEMQMTRNEFMFGTSVVWAVAAEEDHPEYAGIVKKYFNTIVSDDNGKWNNIEADGGKESINQANWAFENDKNFKIHALFWDKADASVYPDSLKDYANMPEEQVRKILRDYMKDYMLTYRGKAPHIDVLNESMYHRGIIDTHGKQVFADMFKYAKQLDPKAKLYLNETGLTGNETDVAVDNFKRHLQSFLDLGAPIDGFGIQAHTVKASYPQHFYNEFEVFGELVDEVAITEYDYITDPSMDSTRAPYLRDMLIMLYSYPKATAFILWGIGDRYSWRSDATLFDGNWAPKPTLAEWEKLVLGEWNTHETGTTDENGELVMRGHRGEYSLKVNHAGKEYAGAFALVKDQGEGYENVIEVNLGAAEVVKANNKVHEPLKPIKATTHTEAAALAGEFSYTDPYEIIATNSSREKAVPHTLDGLGETFWTGNAGSWVSYELADSVSSGTLRIQWRNKNNRKYGYEIAVSDDGTEWKTVSKGATNKKESIEKINGQFKFVKIICSEGAAIEISNVKIDI